MNIEREYDLNGESKKKIYMYIRNSRENRKDNETLTYIVYFTPYYSWLPNLTA